VCPAGQIHGSQRTLDSIARVGQLIQVSEALEVLEHAEAEIKPRGLGPDRDPPPDLDAVLGSERQPSDDGRARRRRDERPEASHGRRLPRTVGPEEAEHLAASHVE
jgi:hypothetical protein